MSRRTSKDDEDSGAWWKLGAAALGAAAVAGVVGAAIYGANKLSEKEEEEKAKKLAQSRPRPAALETTPYFSSDAAQSRPRPAARQTTPYFSNDEGWSCQSSTVTNTSSPTARSDSVAVDGSLKQQLEQYYARYVDIPEEEMEHAQAVVADIKNEYLEYIREKLAKFKVRMVDSGSSVEGLKVIAPDEFDVMLLVESQNMSCFENPDIQEGRKSLPDASGYFHIKAKDLFQAESSRLRSTWPDLTKWEEDGFLSPKSARRAFQSLSSQLFEEYDSYDISTQTLGPAVTVTVQYQQNPRKSLCIDFVPAFKFGGCIYVAKPHPKVLETNGDCDVLYKYLWRRSYSSHEQKFVKQLDGNGCHIKCLKILKAVKVNHPAEMGMFSSYVLKTLLFHMFQEDPCWPNGELQIYFVKMLTRLKDHLEKKKLRSFFQNDINLLEHVSRSQCDHAVNYLRRTLEKKRWKDLLC